jgi:type II secretory pathway component PulM
MAIGKSLNSREKTVIGIGVPLFFLIVGYTYLWLPVQESLDRLRQAVPLKTMELAWMEYELNQAEPWLSDTSEDGANRPLLTVIEKRAVAADVKSAIKRVQPGNNNQVKLWFEDVAADNWLQFINTLSIDGVAVSAATLTRRTNGLINARITVSR